jgi:thioredoxin reductase (NADPH)
VPDASLYDVIIVGAGPAGLAAAIAATRRQMNALVIEQGALVDSLRRFPADMVFFTTPELLEIGGFPFVSPNEKPTRQEALRYYRRVTTACNLPIAYQEPVTALLRRSDGAFTVRSTPAQGAPQERTARAVVLAIGAYDLPNPINVPGEDLPHVSHYFTEPHPYFQRQVVVVGGKNSAAETALDLYRNGAHVTIVHRNAALGDSIKYWVKPDIENRIKEGSIAARFHTRVLEITPDAVRVDGPDGPALLPAAAVFLLTGYHTNTTLLRQAGAAIDDAAGAPIYNADTYETSVPNLFVAGATIGGQQSGKIFIENGRFHGEAVIREIGLRIGDR